MLQAGATPALGEIGLWCEIDQSSAYVETAASCFSINITTAGGATIYIPSKTSTTFNVTMGSANSATAPLLFNVSAGIWDYAWNTTLLGTN